MLPNYTFSPPQKLGLEWAYDGRKLVPTWTILPSIETIQSIAAGYINNLGSSLVMFLTDGSFNKLYSVSDSYVMRVALPIDPYYKTASEVATLIYLQRHTSIPVPRVVAYCADANNELGFEWILMEKMPGEPLEMHMSDAISMDMMEAMAKQVASWVEELRNLKFTAIGSLYFVRQICERGMRIKVAAVDNDPEFCLGPVVDPTWFAGNRVFLPSDRGPFRDETEWFQSELKLKILAAQIRNPGAEMCIEEIERLVGVYSQFLTILPSVFAEKHPAYSSQKRRVYMIHNGHMSANNLLIDPKTFAIAGWVDWACVSTVPSWVARKLPSFLVGKDSDYESLMFKIPENLHEYEDDKDSIETKILHANLRKIWMKVLQIDNGVEEDEAEKIDFQEAILGTERYGSEWGIHWIADREGWNG